MQIVGMEPYPVQNTWAVAPDGRVAVVYADPYRVEWMTPHGGAVSGAPIGYQPVRITNEDREAWADGMSGGSAIMVGVGGMGNMSDGGGGGGGGRGIRPPRPDPDDFTWPEFKPAFPRQAARVAPNGDLWVRRHVRFDQPGTYDIFDASGNRVRQIVLPEGRTLVGIGEERVFLVSVDDDDLQWLEAYRIP